MIEPLLYDTHMHTPLCKHAEGEPEEYASAAEKRGLKGIIFTCHNPMPDGFAAGARMSIEEFDEYVRIVQRAAEAWRGSVDVRLGLECDYFPGIEPWLSRQIESADLHYVLGSVHPSISGHAQNPYLCRTFQTDTPGSPLRLSRGNCSIKRIIERTLARYHQIHRLKKEPGRMGKRNARNAPLRNGAAGVFSARGWSFKVEVS